MKRINSLTYLEGNTTIVFTKVPLLDGEVAQKFSFSVVPQITKYQKWITFHPIQTTTALCSFSFSHIAK